MASRSRYECSTGLGGAEYSVSIESSPSPPGGVDNHRMSTPCTLMDVVILNGSKEINKLSFPCLGCSFFKYPTDYYGCIRGDLAHAISRAAPHCAATIAEDAVLSLLHQANSDLSSTKHHVQIMIHQKEEDPEPTPAQVEIANTTAILEAA